MLLAAVQRYVWQRRRQRAGPVLYCPHYGLTMFRAFAVRLPHVGATIAVLALAACAQPSPPSNQSTKAPPPTYDIVAQIRAAGAKLDSALKIAGDAPDLLQDRAEIYVRQRDYADAEKLARHSYDIGPKLGSLCARNWQTVVEMRLQAQDEAGAANARQELAKCHQAGPVRM